MENRFMYRVPFSLRKDVRKDSPSETLAATVFATDCKSFSEDAVARANAGVFGTGTTGKLKT